MTTGSVGLSGRTRKLVAPNSPSDTAKAKPAEASRGRHRVGTSTARTGTARRCSRQDERHRDLRVAEHRQPGPMTPIDFVLVFLSGAFAGVINVVVGSGTLVTFPVLVAVGLDPVVATMSNAVGLVPGNLAGAWGYRRELSGQGSTIARLLPASLAGSQAAYRAIFDHYGLIEGRDFDEMLDFAVGFLACGKDRLPAGNRMGIVTASGGGGIWTADACAAAGLDVPVLDDPTRRALEEHIPPYGTSENPVDSTAQGVHKMGYAAFARITAESPLIDGVIVVITARRSAFLEGDLQKLKDLRHDVKKPVFMWTYTLPSERSVEILNEGGYPLFTGAPGCARTMRALCDYRERRERLTRRPAARVSSPQARNAVCALLAAAAPVLGEWQARPLLTAYGIDGDDGAVLARSADEAEAAARALNRPVALKIQSPDILHKTEAGGVALNVAAGDVRAAYERVLASARRHAPAATIDGVLVAPMARPGREVILGVNRDPRWGPLLMVGLGGVLVEAMADTALAPVPLDHDAALALIGRLKGARLLCAFRGAPEADVDALAALMVTLSQLAADHADTIAEIDLNPVIVHAKGDGVTVVDALIVKGGAPQAQGRDAAE